MKLSPKLRQWLFAGLTLVMLAYIVMSLLFTASASGNRLCQGVLITVHDTADIHFVTPQELSAQLGDLPQTALNTYLADIDIDSIERELNLFDKIERVNVNILTSGKLLIDVWPMRPVARIFDSAGHSYYINRSGKRIEAEPGYFLDVPVIRGDFTASFRLRRSFRFDYIEANPDWNEAISMIEARSPDDIILVPVIRGHVINLGDTTEFPDKFRRLKLMYAKVMGAKGWDFYKEISVKWRGQVVGVRRNAKLAQPEYILDESNEEETTLETVELDAGSPASVQPEKPIPAAKVKQQKKTDSETAKPDSTSKKSDKTTKTT